MRSNTAIFVLTIVILVFGVTIYFVSQENRKSISENAELHKTYDSLSRELKRTIQERDAFNIRLDSLNLHNKTLLLENDSLTGELGKIKDRYKTKTTLELQKLMIDGAK